jgi:putative tryptophan/tyrosine transport system substrate-binding protein
MNKRAVWVVTILLLTSVHLADAQQPGKVPRIGYVSGTGSPSDPGPYVEALRHGLQDLGYVDGKNIAIEYRGAEGKPERYASLVKELVQLKVDVIVVPTLPAILAAREATKTIPIVMVANTDPVATGLVDNLARPGGNITGLSTLAQDLSGKRLELLRKVSPRMSRVGVLRDADSQNSAIAFKEYEATARALKVQLRSLGVRGPNPDLEGAFQTASKERIDAIITITNSNLFIQQKRIVDLAITNRDCLQCIKEVLGGRVRWTYVLFNQRYGRFSPRRDLR